MTGPARNRSDRERAEPHRLGQPAPSLGELLSGIQSIVRAIRAPSGSAAQKVVAHPLGHQIRVARALLGWSAQTLADRSGTSVMVVDRAERSQAAREVSDVDLSAIRAILEEVGVAFTLDPAGTAGVRLTWGMVESARDSRSWFERAIDESDLLFLVLYAFGWDPFEYLLPRRW